MRPLLLSLLVLGLTLSGCASKTAPDGATTPTGPMSGAPLGTNATDPGVVPPLADAQYNMSFDLTVTYASPAAGLGTNFAQNNCIEFDPVAMQNGTATLTWTAGTGSEQLELVIRNFQNSDNANRLVGASPLSMPFQFALGSSTIIFSVQSPPTGAITQVPVQLEIGFQHPGAESPQGTPRTCAF